MPNKLDQHDIKDLRTRSKMTQVELAEYLGVEKGTISRWELGTQKPSKLALRQLHRLHKKLK